MSKQSELLAKTVTPESLQAFEVGVMQAALDCKDSGFDQADTGFLLGKHLKYVLEMVFGEEKPTGTTVVNTGSGVVATGGGVAAGAGGIAIGGNAPKGVNVYNVFNKVNHETTAVSQAELEVYALFQNVPRKHQEAISKALASNFQSVGLPMGYTAMTYGNFITVLFEACLRYYGKETALEELALFFNAFYFENRKDWK